MKLFVIAAMLGAACAHQLAPGETDCKTARERNVFGQPTERIETNCRSYVPHPEKDVTGWWCTTRGDGVGFCARQPGACEVIRTSYGDGPYGECRPQSPAICATTSDCFPNPSSCTWFEHNAGRSGAVCFAAP